MSLSHLEFTSVSQLLMLEQLCNDFSNVICHNFDLNFAPPSTAAASSSACAASPVAEASNSQTRAALFRSMPGTSRWTTHLFRIDSWAAAPIITAMRPSRADTGTKDAPVAAAKKDCSSKKVAPSWKPALARSSGTGSVTTSGTPRRSGGGGTRPSLEMDLRRRTLTVDSGALASTFPSSQTAVTVSVCSSSANMQRSSMALAPFAKVTVTKA
mmetsp:Transcript_34292/g.74059  ORF Transcript_34292/g.74059 Transcript_34292/m.74059 type:complete len:213 (-) Transcript_34292:1929-2567(-)